MNTETNHTPAPWWRDDDGFVASGTGDNYVTVADANCSNDIDISEREANTALIVASPDLLAVAIEAVRLYESYGLLAQPLAGDAFAAGNWINSTRDAIRKALAQPR